MESSISSGLCTVAAGSVELNSGGTIVGGTLVATGGTFGWAGGTLDGVTYQGTLNLSQATSSVYIQDGFTLTGAGGSGGATINLTGTGKPPSRGWHRDPQQRHPEHRQRHHDDYLYNYDLPASPF